MAYAALVRCLYLAVAFLHSRGGGATRKIGANAATRTGEHATMVTDSKTRINERAGPPSYAAQRPVRREGLVYG